jgi:hypothetical protein
MKKWILLLALLSPAVARANTITPQFTQGSMNSTTTTTQTIKEVSKTQVYGAEVKTWSGTNITPSGDIADTATTFSLTTPGADFQLEITERSAGIIETIDTVRSIDTDSTTTSYSVFSQ